MDQQFNVADRGEQRLCDDVAQHGNERGCARRFTDVPFIAMKTSDSVPKADIPFMRHFLWSPCMMSLHNPCLRV